MVGESKDSVIEPIQKVLEEMIQLDPEFKAQVSYAYGTESCYTGSTIEGERFFPGWVLDESDEFVQCVLSGLKKSVLTQPLPNIHFVPTVATMREANIPTIGFGPSEKIWLTPLMNISKLDN